MIKPQKQGEILASDIRRAKGAGCAESFDIWWLGQSGFLLQWNKKCLLFDPYLSDSLTKKYAGTNKPHVRMSERVIEPHLLDCIDVVTSSHNHTDHLDAETLLPILRINPTIKFIIPEANRSFVADRLKCEITFPIGMNDGVTKAIDGFIFHGVPAAHNELERDDKGYCRFMGFVVHFGKFTVYHSGDTIWYADMVKTLKPFAVDVAFLPINGNDPLRGVAGNLDTKEAAILGKEIEAQLIIPHHYNLFEFNTADVREFEKEANQINQPFHTLKLGERLTIGAHRN